MIKGHMISRFALVFLMSSLQAEDWPQFRGPGGEGHSAEKNLPLQWSETSNIAWKTAIPGRGWSSPSVSNGAVWLTAEVDTGLHLYSLESKSGKILKDITVFSPRSLGTQHAKNTHASPTPILEDGRVYVHFGSHGTAAVNTDGQILWKTTMDYEPMHGTGGSPVIFKDLLIFSCDGTDVQFVVALNKNAM